jgi:hypothetical protein
MRIKNFTGHLRTVNHHRWLVFIHCCRAGIVWQGLKHDLSKYSPAEFIPGVRYYQGGMRSPNEKERALYGYSPAWLHHKGRNKHHFEYWNDYDPVSKRVKPVKMPARYLAEMVCDRMAASKTYMKEDYSDSAPLEYFLKSAVRKKDVMHPETAAKLTELLTILSREGEKALFAALRKMLKEERAGRPAGSKKSTEKE